MKKAALMICLLIVFAGCSVHTYAPSTRAFGSFGCRGHWCEPAMVGYDGARYFGPRGEACWPRTCYRPGYGEFACFRCAHVYRSVAIYSPPSHHRGWAPSHHRPRPVRSHQPAVNSRPVRVVQYRIVKHHGVVKAKVKTAAAPLPARGPGRNRK